MSEQGRSKLVFLFGCTEAVRAQVNFDTPWARTVFGATPRVWEFSRLGLGTWWSELRYEKFFRSRPEYFLQLDEYLRATIHAQMFAAGFTYYEGWEQDVALIIIGDEYRPDESPVVRGVFQSVFPFGNFFPANCDRILESRLWDSETSSPATVSLGDPLDVLRLSVRVYNRLRNKRIATIGQLVAKTADQLGQIDGIGDGALREINAALRRFGLELTV
jgi:hypothetical protein